jgi:hypothetical protein
MKRHHLLILVVAAAVAVLAALWARKLHEPEHAGGTGALLAPGLEAKLNDVTVVTVKGKNAQTSTLERGADAWTVREKSGYPADTGKVRKLLIGIAQSKLVEQKTSNAEHYGELGVVDPAAAPAATPPAEAADTGATPPKKEESAGVLVEIQAPVEGQEDKVALIIGNSARGATGTYVRKVDDTQSWLASGDLSVQADPLSWIDRQIMNVPANRIQQVTIRHPDGQTLIIDKSTREEPNYTVHDLPAKREVKYASVGNPLASVLATLRLDDIAPLAEKDPASHSPIEVEYRTFDGLVVKTQTFVEGDKHWAHFVASFDEDLARRFYVPPAPATPPAEGASTPDASAESDATAETAAEPPAPGAGDATTAAPDAAKPAEATSTAPTAVTAAPAAPAAPAPPAEPDFSAARAEAETINKKVAPWVFVIGSYKYEQIDKHVTDMLKEEEAAKAKPEAKKPATKKPAEPKTSDE